MSMGRKDENWSPLLLLLLLLLVVLPVRVPLLAANGDPTELTGLSPQNCCDSSCPGDDSHRPPSPSTSRLEHWLPVAHVPKADNERERDRMR